MVWCLHDACSEEHRGENRGEGQAVHSFVPYLVGVGCLSLETSRIAWQVRDGVEDEIRRKMASHRYFLLSARCCCFKLSMWRKCSCCCVDDLNCIRDAFPHFHDTRPLPKEASILIRIPALPL